MSKKDAVIGTLTAVMTAVTYASLIYVLNDCITQLYNSCDVFKAIILINGVILPPYILFKTYISLFNEIYCIMQELKKKEGD